MSACRVRLTVVHAPFGVDLAHGPSDCAGVLHHGHSRNARDYPEPRSPLFLCYAVFMANTRSATLSIRLKSQTKRRLARLAEASGRSSNFLISDAVESYVADQERMLAEMRQSDRQVKSGHYVRHEDMKAWLLSWGTERELPPPKCVCGKVHGDESPRPNSRG
jgi:predicted transcriptional regulator